MPYDWFYFRSEASEKETSNLVYFSEQARKCIPSWVHFDLVKNVSKDKTFHPCQIPTGLVEMLIKASTKENDKIVILFGGSGNEILLCKSLKRQFFSAEIDKEYYNMIKDRLKNGGVIKEDYKLRAIDKIRFFYPQKKLFCA